MELLGELANSKNCQRCRLPKLRINKPYFKTKATQQQLENAVREKYKGRYCVRVKNTIPAIRYVANTNFIDIAVYKKDDTAIIVSAIDNLLKGASGQAVQCFNIMHNIEETTGLI